MQAFSADFTYIRLEMFVWNRTTAAGVAYMADVFAVLRKRASRMKSATHLWSYP